MLIVTDQNRKEIQPLWDDETPFQRLLDLALAALAISENINPTFDAARLGSMATRRWFELQFEERNWIVENGGFQP